MSTLMASWGFVFINYKGSYFLKCDTMLSTINWNIAKFYYIDNYLSDLLDLT